MAWKAFLSCVNSEIWSLASDAKVRGEVYKVCERDRRFLA